MTHGTWATYQRGCREECCTTAARNYQKRRLVDANRGVSRSVDPTGTRRRIEALACLGWSGYDIASRLGHSHEWIRQITLGAFIHRRTAERVASVYDALCMSLPATDTHVQRATVARTKSRAARLGYLPPLAWDDIDDPSEKPRQGTDHLHYRAHELLAEWHHLRASGESIHQAARQLGVTVEAIEKAGERVAQREAS